MAGQVDMRGLAEGRHLQEVAAAPVAGHVRLRHVDRPGRERPAQVVERVGVHARRDLHAGRRGRHARGVALRLTADLHLHGVAAGLLDEGGELLAQLSVVEAGNPAAAVDLRRVPRPTEQVGQRQSEQASLQIPQADVEGRDRGGRQAGPAEVAHRAPKHGVRPRDIQGGAAREPCRQGLRDKRRDAGVGVAVAETGSAPGLDQRDHQGPSGPN
jgi:hypothetical protein